MEIIYSDTALEDAFIRNTIENLFPVLQVFMWDFTAEQPVGYHDKDPHHIFFNLYSDLNKPEFAHTISIYRLPESHSQERSLLIGRALSLKVNTRILVPYIHPQEPENPYYDILFIQGKTFLADDYNTAFADGEGGRLKIISPLDIPDYRFNNIGEWLG